MLKTENSLHATGQADEARFRTTFKKHHDSLGSEPAERGVAVYEVSGPLGAILGQLHSSRGNGSFLKAHFSSSTVALPYFLG